MVGAYEVDELGVGLPVEAVAQAEGMLAVEVVPHAQSGFDHGRAI